MTIKEVKRYFKDYDYECGQRNIIVKENEDI